MTFGEYIRKHRVDRGMTLRSASLATGLSSTNLGKIERHCADLILDEEKDAICRGYQIEDKDTFYLMAAYYKPDQERIKRESDIHAALARGDSSEDMAKNFGIFVCKGDHKHE